LHPSGVAKASTGTSLLSFGWGKGGKITAARWQVTLCDPISHVISRSSEVISITNCYIRFAYLLTCSASQIMLFYDINRVDQWRECRSPERRDVGHVDAQ